MAAVVVAVVAAGVAATEAAVAAGAAEAAAAGCFVAGFELDPFWSVCVCTDCKVFLCDLLSILTLKKIVIKTRYILLQLS